MRLAGKVAVVTGSTRGIGRAIAVEYAAEGACVAVVGRSADRGEAVVAEIADAGGEAVFFEADLGQEAQARRVIEQALQKWGRVDILVNNAAPTDALADKVDGPLTDLTTERWRALLAVGLDSALWIGSSALRAMMAQGGGVMINISSLAASHGLAGLDAYTAMKGALSSLTRSVAVEYAPYGIRSNTIVVGLVRVSENPSSVVNDPRNAQRLAEFSLTRPGMPRDIALAAVYLASDEAEFVTGIDLVVDGGASVKLGLPAVSRPLDETVKKRSDKTSEKE